MSVVNTRALRNEADWLPCSIDEALAVRRDAVDAGVPQQLASGLMAWLIVKAAGEPDTTSAPTRSRYRRVLRDLEAAGFDPPGTRCEGHHIINLRSPALAAA